MSSELEEDNVLQEDSEDELDWEEVEVPEHQAPHLEITLQLNPKASSNANANKRKGITHAERLVRIDCHKIHTVALISSARVRNYWINNPLLQARLLSLTPLHLQNAFGVIHKSRVPDQNQRGRMFERAIENVTHWWANSFFEVIPDGHVRSHLFDEIQRKLEIRGLHLKNEDDPDTTTLDLETLEDIVGDDAEVIRSSKSLMKHALMRSGSRDTGAQLFTALCRALGVPARLVVSVQSVPWQAGVGKPKPKHEKKSKGKGKGKEVVEEEEAADPSSSSKWDQMDDTGRRLDDVAVHPKSEKAKGKQKAKPVIKLRKTKSKGNVLGKPKRLASPDPLTTPPVYWTEVFSRPDSKWFPVDPIRAIVNKRKMFDPSSSGSNANTQTNSTRFALTKVENRMVYVIAFEEDGYARDVTRRYAREYSAKVIKVQGGSSAPNVSGGGKGRQAWWDKVVHSIERPFRLNRDDLEDQELEAVQLMEGMPTTMTGFKDHPLYVLTRHLKQTETIHPPPPTTPEVGKFRGEPVYPRSSVVSLKTAENWMRNTGRSVKAGEQPMKMVKVRAGTVNRMRELEVLKDELNVAGENGPSDEGSSVGEIMQGLYAFSQTEPYIPDPVVDGKVPKNNFGNIDLYVPSMLPRGGVHIPFKGIAKIARNLGFDFAEAVTGFEFKKRRAFPIVEGVVVAAENEEALLEAFWEAEREAEEKARTKREERALKHWMRLIHGLRIRHRVQEQYSKKSHERSHEAKAEVESKADNKEDSREGSPHNDPSDTAGGFLAGADRVVHAFHLPKNTHVVLPSPRNTTEVAEEEVVIDEDEEEPSRATGDFVTYDLETMDEDPENMEEVPVLSPPSVNANTTEQHQYVPKTMQQIAEDAARQQNNPTGREDGDGLEEVNLTSPPPAAGGKKGENKITLTLPVRVPSTSTLNSLSNTRSLRSRAGKTANSRAMNPSGSLTQAFTPPTSNGKPTRASAPKPKSKYKRKRGVKAAGRSDSEAESVDEGEGEDEVMIQVESSPSKRRKKAKTTPMVIPPSTRTLRPRTSKTPAQIEEERQVEEAYRKAMAE